MFGLPFLFGSGKALKGASAPKTNIVNPAAWANPSAGTVAYDGPSDTVNFTGAGNGTNISNTPLQALKANTTYNVTLANKTGGSVQLRYGAVAGTAVLWSGSTVIATGANVTTTFTTGAADLGDGKIYYRCGNINVTAALTGLSIIEA